LNGIYVGSAALKLQELGDVYPSNKYWLGSVFVMEQYRGSRIASAMTMKIVKIARERNLPHLYLQTINLSGGLYSELGWQVIEQFNYKDEDTLLMMKALGL
jgi:GNAT superfamily N-acetyltransferase